MHSRALVMTGRHVPAVTQQATLTGILALFVIAVQCLVTSAIDLPVLDGSWLGCPFL